MGICNCVWVLSGIRVGTRLVAKLCMDLEVEFINGMSSLCEETLPFPNVTKYEMFHVSLVPSLRIQTPPRL